MSIFTVAIHRFFEDYEKTFQNSLNGQEVDPHKIADCFAPYFVEANPKGVMGAANDKKFLESIPKGYEYYNSVGAKSMRIGEKTITIIDEWHAMVKIHWLSEYLRKDGKTINMNFDVHYFVQKLEEQDAPKIFAFVTGDEQQLMKLNGLA